MEFGDQIKKYRSEIQMSQEQLADRVYVSRQTISNWENGKSYPDINSLVLLSEVFQTSIDNLIKGDIEIMKKEVKDSDVNLLNTYVKISSIIIFVCLICFYPVYKYLGWYGIAVWAIVYAIGTVFALKCEKIKKDNNIRTYKEILAFMEGKTLDEVTKNAETKKIPYDTILKMLCGAGFALIVCGIMSLIFR